MRRVLSSLATARTAIVLGTLVFAVNVTAIVVMVLAHYSIAELVRLSALVPTVAIGTLVAVRRPRNPMGWLMLGAGFFFTTQALGTGYAILDYHLHHGSLPLGRVAIAFQPGWAMGMVFIAGLLWLFPDGDLPSGRWRRVGGLLFASGIALGAGDVRDVGVRRRLTWPACRRRRHPFDHRKPACLAAALAALDHHPEHRLHRPDPVLARLARRPDPEVPQVPR